MNLENRLKSEVSSLFQRMGKRVTEELEVYWNDNVLLQGQLNLILAPIHELHEEYNNLLTRYRLQVFHNGYDSGKRIALREFRKHTYSNKARTGVSFTKNHNHLFGTLQETEDQLRNDTFIASESTLSRVDDSISQILSDGYKNGKGIADVRNQLMQRFDQLKDWEANRIARTEIHTAHNLGRRTGYKELGVQYTQWIAHIDHRTRISHGGYTKGKKGLRLTENHSVNGEIKPIDGTYSNGLRYPGDKSGPIEEWINCRCSEAPYIMAPDKMAPPGMTNFRESDLVSTTEPDYNQLITNATGGKLNWNTYRDMINNINYTEIGVASQTTNDNIPVELEELSQKLGMSVEDLLKLTDEEILKLIGN